METAVWARIETLAGPDCVDFAEWSVLDSHIWGRVGQRLLVVMVCSVRH